MRTLDNELGFDEILCCMCGGLICLSEGLQEQEKDWQAFWAEESINDIIESGSGLRIAEEYYLNGSLSGEDDAYVEHFTKQIWFRNDQRIHLNEHLTNIYFARLKTQFDSDIDRIFSTYKENAS